MTLGEQELLDLVLLVQYWPALHVLRGGGGDLGGLLGVPWGSLRGEQGEQELLDMFQYWPVLHDLVLY